MKYDNKGNGHKGVGQVFSLFVSIRVFLALIL